MLDDLMWNGRNTLYYGDNLNVLRQHVPDASIDLVYLDPPFNSNADYNVLFADHDVKAAAQIKAFEDTWTWDAEAARQYEDLVAGGGRVADVMEAYRKFLGQSDMMAYLTMMAPRLVELRRVMKDSASIYLHCDPTASHHLKILMDAVFGGENYRNEIIWKRTSGHSDATRYGNVHDCILYYVKTPSAKWNTIYQPYEKEYVEQYYRFSDDDGRKWMSADLGAAGLQGGGYDYDWKGVRRTWRCPVETMQRYEKEGRLYHTKNGIPRLKRYLDEAKGLPAQDLWTDIEALRSWHDEKLGYPTQKPEALLERILAASTDEGDIVLDPFCGCGTAIAAAQRLNRTWIGIDITHLAINLIKHRLTGFGSAAGKDYTVVGEPTTMEDAAKLAEEDKYQFQFWSLGLVGARPVEEKKGADKGIDGRRRFFARPGKNEKPLEVIYSVKAGQSVPANAHRDLLGVIEREKAAFGVLITMAEPTSNMKRDAAGMGMVRVEGYEGARTHPRIQVVTVGELLQGKTLDLPVYATAGGDRTLKAAPQRQAQKVDRKRTPRLGEFADPGEA